MRVVFMGTPSFGVPILEALLGAGAGHEVVAVYTQPDRPAGRGQEVTQSPVKVLALAHGLPVYQPQRLKGEVETLARLAPEAVIVAGYGLLVPPAILAIPPVGCVNVHPSLLPRHRGPSPVTATILAGDEVTGVTVMQMDPGFDTGPILAQRTAPVQPEDTTLSLTARLAGMGAELLLETLPRLQAGEITPRPQGEGATYSQMLRREQADMDWRVPAIVLWRQVRAYHPWPGTHTTWQGQRLKVLEAAPAPGQAAPGQVVALEKGIGVGTGDGILELRRVQLEGKKAVTGEEFARGHRGFVGAVLPTRKQE